MRAANDEPFAIPCFKGWINEMEASVTDCCCLEEARDTHGAGIIDGAEEDDVKDGKVDVGDGNAEVEDEGAAEDA